MDCIAFGCCLLALIRDEILKLVQDDVVRGFFYAVVFGGCKRPFDCAQGDIDFAIFDIGLRPFDCAQGDIGFAIRICVKMLNMLLYTSK